MTVKECYADIGDYDEVMGRLRAEERVVKFLSRIPADPSYSELKAAVESGRAEDAFRASHTLKGICLNLSLTKLFASANALTEALRGKTAIASDIEPLFEKVTQDYELTINAIKSL